MRVMKMVYNVAELLEAQRKAEDWGQKQGKGR
jgi:hypothetical protein